MPSGAVHERVNVAILLGAAALRAAAVPRPIAPEEVAFAVGYAVGTFWITPDLDFANAHPVQAVRNWGRLSFIWAPYGALFRHRGLSHTYLLGPLTRLAYLAFLVLVVVAMFAPGWVNELFARGFGAFPPPLDHPGLWAAGVAGYYVAQWIHLALDGVRPGARQRRRRRRT